MFWLQGIGFKGSDDVWLDHQVIFLVKDTISFIVTSTIEPVSNKFQHSKTTHCWYKVLRLHVSSHMTKNVLNLKYNFKGYAKKI